MTYLIYVSHRDKDGKWKKVVERGIPDYATANTRRNELQGAYDAAHREKGSWTADIYICEQEVAA